MCAVTRPSWSCSNPRIQVTGQNTAALILNVRNRSALSVVDDDAVVEIPCVVDANGPHAVVINQLPAHASGLVAGVFPAVRAARVQPADALRR